MKRVTVTLRPEGARLPPAAHVYRAAGAVDRAEGLQWNVSGDPTTLMARVEGDPEGTAAALEAHPTVIDYDLVAVEDRECYVRTRSERTEVARQLFGRYADSELIVVPPVEYDDRGMVMTVVGEPGDLQRGVDAPPDGIAVSVESVGEFASVPGPVLARLSDRQREALTAAVEVGYYDVPRETTHEAVAERLGVAPSTASEHLRKAESKVVRALVEEGTPDG